MARGASQPTLHEAMAMVMRGRGWADRDEVARVLAEREIYRRPKDGLPPPSYQLGMRVRKRPDWFEARGPGGAQIRLVPGGPGESVADADPASTNKRSRPRAGGSTDQISSAASAPTKKTPASADAKKARERRQRGARKYRPTQIKTLLVAEAPPAALERYFYFEDVGAHDSLFLNVAKAILSTRPERQEKGQALTELRALGFFLIDLFTDPIDGGLHDEHVPALVRRVRKLAPAKVILIKAPVYDSAFATLRDAGLPVVDERVPFPGSGQQKNFAKAFARALAR